MDLRTVSRMIGKPVVYAKFEDDEISSRGTIGRIIGLTDNVALVEFGELGGGMSCDPRDLYAPDELILMCDRCRYPALVLPSGAIAHASAADGMFCEMVYPN